MCFEMQPVPSPGAVGEQEGRDPAVGEQEGRDAVFVSGGGWMQKWRAGDSGLPSVSL